MTIKLRSRLLGAHVHVTVFMGADEDHLQNSGDLVMGVGQWAAYVQVLADGVPASRFDADPVVLLLDHDDRPLDRALFSHCDDRRARQMPSEPAPTEKDEPCPNPSPAGADASAPKKNTPS
jgi:hypothetical protein